MIDPPSAAAPPHVASECPECKVFLQLIRAAKIGSSRPVRMLVDELFSAHLRYVRAMIGGRQGDATNEPAAITDTGTATPPEDPLTDFLRVEVDPATALADLRDAVEIMDRKITPFGERDDGTVATYIVSDSTWHRVVAVARGSTSDKARAAIDAHRAARPATDPAGLDGLISPGTVEDVAVAMHDARITGCAFSGGKQMCSPRDHMEDAKVYLRARRARIEALGHREEPSR